MPLVTVFFPDNAGSYYKAIIDETATDFFEKLGAKRTAKEATGQVKTVPTEKKYELKSKSKFKPR